MSKTIAALPRPDGPRTSSTDYDVAIIGGGINGTAAAASLAERGYGVVLLEANDFGSGSTSRSSRLMHCGLNYLAAAHAARGPIAKLKAVKAAREMMQERASLQRRFPENVVPKTFMMPLFKSDEIGPRQYDLAFAVLRSLAGYRLPLDYRRYSGPALREHPLSGFFGPDLSGLVSFTELIFQWPERLCIDYALEAAAAGATVLNYTRVTAARQLDDRWILEYVGSRTGDARGAVNARAILNLAGVWSDEVSRLSDHGLLVGEVQTVTPNKGCHVAIRLPEAFRDHGIIRRNELGHLFLSVPWGDYHILGPTETVVTERSDSVTAGVEDVNAILADARQVLSGAEIRKADVLYDWAGYRPATFDPTNPRGTWKREFYRNTRNRAKPLWMSMSWGRLADHRSSAETVSRAVVDHIGLPRHRAAAVSGPVAGGTHDDQLARIVATEAPSTVADVMFRRTGWGWSADLGISRLSEVVAALAKSDLSRRPHDLEQEYREFLQKNYLSNRVEGA